MLAVGIKDNGMREPLPQRKFKPLENRRPFAAILRKSHDMQLLRGGGQCNHAGFAAIGGAVDDHDYRGYVFQNFTNRAFQQRSGIIAWYNDAMPRVS